jgi:hypothetical protein
MLSQQRLLVGLAGSALLASSLFVRVTPVLAHTCPVDGRDVTLREFVVGDAHVELCHGTASEQNPYVIIDPDVNGACGHWREHLRDRPADSNQNQDIFPEGFLAATSTLCV